MNASRIRVKMCGMTRAEDIGHAIDLGVDAIGFIFYEKSPRYLTIKKAKQLIKNLPPFVDAVAVLVNPSEEWVNEIVSELPIQFLQFHGEESPQFCEQFQKPFIKAVHPTDGDHIHRVLQNFDSAQALLLDTPSEHSRGGTGVSFDWNIIPRHLSKPYILAGGLNEFNIKDAIKACNPYAVDVCSGVEASPGIKDHSKMSRLMKVLWEIK